MTDGVERASGMVRIVIVGTAREPRGRRGIRESKTE
jgi:hypothetical protein